MQGLFDAADPQVVYNYRLIHKYRLYTGYYAV